MDFQVQLTRQQEPDWLAILPLQDVAGKEIMLVSQDGVEVRFPATPLIAASRIIQAVLKEDSLFPAISLPSCSVKTIHNLREFLMSGPKKARCNKDLKEIFECLEMPFEVHNENKAVVPHSARERNVSSIGSLENEIFHSFNEEGSHETRKQSLYKSFGLELTSDEDDETIVENVVLETVKRRKATIKSKEKGSLENEIFHSFNKEGSHEARKQSLYKSFGLELTSDEDDETIVENVVLETAKRRKATIKSKEKRKHLEKYQIKQSFSSISVERNRSATEKEASRICDQYGNGKIFSQNWNLRRHMLKFHGGNTRSAVQPASAREQGVRKQPISNQGLKRVNWKKQFTCDHCGAHFTQNKSLKRHVDSVHKKLRIECKQCEKKFTCKKNLLRHVSSAHMKLRHKCDECPATYANKEQLKDHKDSKHKGKTYSCRFPGCSFISINRNSRNVHETQVCKRKLRKKVLTF